MSGHRKLFLDIVVTSGRLCFPKYCPYSSSLRWGDLPDWNVAGTKTGLELKSAPTIRGDFKLSTVVCFREFYVFRVCYKLRPYLRLWCKC